MKGMQSHSSDPEGGRPLRAPAALGLLHQSCPVFGLVQVIPSIVVTELNLSFGFDYIILDCEKGRFRESDVVASLRVISAASHAFTLVRVRAHDFSAITTYLACGAHGILMPHVCTAAQAREYVECAREATERLKCASPLLLAMIEEKEAVHNIEAIASTVGVSGLVIGPRDLAEDLGVEEDFSIPEFQSAFVHVEEAARRNRLLLGTRVPRGCTMNRVLSAGHRLLLAGSDTGILSEGYRLCLEEVRTMQSQWQWSHA